MKQQFIQKENYKFLRFSVSLSVFSSLLLNVIPLPIFSYSVYLYTNSHSPDFVHTEYKYPSITTKKLYY